MLARDEFYVNILLTPLQKCASYKPAFGLSENAGISIDQFTDMYSKDPLYHWMGLDSPLMYAAHKAAGGMTSIYRQLGIGCERLFRQILFDNLELTSEEVKWSYKKIDEKGKESILTLDGRIKSSEIRNLQKRESYMDWLYRICKEIEVDPVARQLEGSVFEVRQGYKSADSKRQNADLSNGSKAYSEGYLPVVMIFSRQINQIVERRYRIAKLVVLVGELNGSDTTSTFSFCRSVVGFDLPGFLKETPFCFELSSMKF